MPMNTEPVKIELTGRIDSNNSFAVEEEIMGRLSGLEACPVILDADKLEYISSAGLRVILRVKKTFPDLTITNVSSGV